MREELSSIPRGVKEGVKPWESGSRGGFGLGKDLVKDTYDVSLKYYLLHQVTLFYPVGTKLISEWKEMRERIEFNDKYSKSYSTINQTIVLLKKE